MTQGHVLSLKNDYARQELIPPVADRDRPLDVLSGHERGPVATLRAPRPLRPTIPTEHRAEDKSDFEQDCLKRTRHEEHGLSLAMAMYGVGHIEQRRTIQRPRVYDFEHGLQVAI